MNNWPISQNNVRPSNHKVNHKVFYTSQSPVKQRRTDSILGGKNRLRLKSVWEKIDFLKSRSNKKSSQKSKEHFRTVVSPSCFSNQASSYGTVNTVKKIIAFDKMISPARNSVIRIRSPSNSTVSKQRSLRSGPSTVIKSPGYDRSRRQHLYIPLL